MYKCDCGREFTTKSGLGYHKNYCGKNKISYDHYGYQYRVGNNGNLIYTHREVLEQKLGRKLLLGEVSHHIDENKLNNDPDNLELTNNSKHGKIHWDVIVEDKNNFNNTKLTKNQVREIKIKLSI